MTDLSQRIAAAYYLDPSSAPGHRSLVPEQGSSADSHKLWMKYPARKRCAVLAILFPLDRAETDYGVVLTQRSPALRTSPSVSAFPGGRLDPEDNDDEWTCALREAREEIGFDPDSVPGFERLAVSPCYLSLGNDAVRVCICKATLDLGDEAGGSARRAGEAGGERPVEKAGFLQLLAPKPSPSEVALVYAVPLARLLTKDWYVRGTPMPVAGELWIFHKYRVPVGGVLGVERSAADGASEMGGGGGYQDSDEEIQEELRQQAAAPEPTEEVPQWSTRTPRTLEYSAGETAIPLHGLTSHMVLDLARAVHPELGVSFEVLGQLGSDGIVRQYWAATYGSINSNSGSLL